MLAWIKRLFTRRPKYGYLEYVPRMNDRPQLVLNRAGLGRSADYSAALRTSIRNAGLVDYNDYN